MFDNIQKGLIGKDLSKFPKMRYIYVGFSAALVIYYLIYFGFESPFVNLFGRYTPFHYAGKSGYTLPNFPDKFAVYTALSANLIQILSGFYEKTNSLIRLGNILTIILLLPISIYLLMVVGLAMTISFFIWVLYMVYRYIVGK